MVADITVIYHRHMNESAIDTNRRRAAKLSKLASFYVAGVFLSYAILYLWTCPRMDFALALGAEFGFCCLSLMLVQTCKTHFGDRLERFLKNHKLPPVTRHINDVMTHIRLLVLCLVSAVFTWDAIACYSAALGCEQLSQDMYCTGPGSQLLGLHPAFTLECLGGACTESARFDQAQRIYLEILQIRTRLAGPHSDLVAAIDADLGDLSVRRHDWMAAEQWYRASVSIGSRKGRALTGLATVLRNQGKYPEAKICYEKALAVRAKLFGQTSKQYGDTLRGYTQLLAKMNK